MLFRLDNLLENWASLYKPLSHDKAKGSKDKRFYRIKSIATDNEFGRNSNVAKSPSMLFSVLIDAQANGKSNFISYRYEVYFVSKAVSRGLAKTARQDDDLGADHQLLMDEMVQDLLAYLHLCKHTGSCPIENTEFDDVTKAGLKGLRLDDAQWASIPLQFKNEWHVMGLSIEGIAQRDLCVDKELYNIEDPVDPTTDPSVDPTVDPTTDPTVDPNADPTTDPTTDSTNGSGDGSSTGGSSSGFLNGGSGGGSGSGDD